MAQAQAQQATALQTYSNVPKNAIFVQNGKEYVILANGTPMLMGQYLSLPQEQRPSITGQQQLGVYGQPALPGAAQPAATAVTPPATGGAPTTRAPAPTKIEGTPLPPPAAPARCSPGFYTSVRGPPVPGLSSRPRRGACSGPGGLVVFSFLFRERERRRLRKTRRREMCLRRSRR